MLLGMREGGFQDWMIFADGPGQDLRNSSETVPSICEDHHARSEAWQGVEAQGYGERVETWFFAYTIASMRRSGINQSIAMATYSAMAIAGRTKASGIANT